MAVYTRLSKKEAASIARAYELGTVSAFEGIAKGSVNTNYRLETPSGTFFVRLDETRTKADVLAEGELVDQLASKGFPTPRSLADRGGHRARLFRKKPLCVYPWVPGEDKPADDYTLADLREAGRVLALLHAASAGFTPRVRNRFGLIATAARWARVRLKAQIPETHRREIDEAVASFSRAPRPPGPSGVVHGDWFADNLLFDAKGRIVSVLDFEAASVDHLTFDVATAINALCWRRKNPDRFDRARVEALMTGYAREGAASLDETVLAFWLRASALRFTVTRIVDFRTRKSSLRVAKDYRDFLRRLRFWNRGFFPRATSASSRRKAAGGASAAPLKSRRGGRRNRG